MKRSHSIRCQFMVLVWCRFKVITRIHTILATCMDLKRQKLIIQKLTVLKQIIDRITNVPRRKNQTRNITQLRSLRKMRSLKRQKNRAKNLPQILMTVSLNRWPFRQEEHRKLHALLKMTYKGLWTVSNSTVTISWAKVAKSMTLLSNASPLLKKKPSGRKKPQTLWLHRPHSNLVSKQNQPKTSTFLTILKNVNRKKARNRIYQVRQFTRSHSEQLNLSWAKLKRL